MGWGQLLSDDRFCSSPAWLLAGSVTLDLGLSNLQLPHLSVEILKGPVSVMGGIKVIHLEPLAQCLAQKHSVPVGSCQSLVLSVAGPSWTQDLI